MVEAKLWAEIMSLRRRNTALVKQVSELQELLGLTVSPDVKNQDLVRPPLEAAEQDQSYEALTQGLHSDAAVQTDACDGSFAPDAAQPGTSFGSLDAGLLISPASSLIGPNAARHRLDSDADCPALEELWTGCGGEVTVSAETYNDLLRSLKDEVAARRKLEEEMASLRRDDALTSHTPAKNSSSSPAPAASPTEPVSPVTGDTLTPGTSPLCSHGSSSQDGVGNPFDEDLASAAQESSDPPAQHTKEHIICTISEDIVSTARHYSLDEFLDTPATA